MSWVALSTHAMATRFELLVYGSDPARIRGAGEEALAEIQRLDRQLSFFLPESEVTWINAHAASAPVKVEPRLMRLLSIAVGISQETDGAFDITVGPAVRARRLTRDSSSICTLDIPREVRDCIGTSHIVLDVSNSTVMFDRPGVQIDLGGIGKGYAIEMAAELLREAGVTSAFLHGGTSTSYAIGCHPDGKPWNVGIRDPQGGSGLVAVVELSDTSLSVSATFGSLTSLKSAGCADIVDPRRGHRIAENRLAFVTGPSPTISDALSTALIVLGEKGIDTLQARFSDYRGSVILA